MKHLLCTLLLAACCYTGFGQSKLAPASEVNVFLGTSADHGQMSPAACSPFSMLSICPQTYPSIHTGYEYGAKDYKGFVHTLFEGVGCRGSGGNILIKPFRADPNKPLERVTQQGAPGYYAVSFDNGIDAQFTVMGKEGRHDYHFPSGAKGLLIDFSYTLINGFVDEAHQVNGNKITGWVEAGTTCRAGKYKWYYCFAFDEPIQFKDSSQHCMLINIDPKVNHVSIKVGLSTVSADDATAAISDLGFEALKKKANSAWNEELDKIQVKGNPQREALFYSELYRTMQSPYMISEPDGSFRATNGSVHKDSLPRYNGWSVWDNYHTQLPLLSILSPDRYQGMVTSLASLYLYGKKNMAGLTEPTNTVRTEHTAVVLLDAYNKGYKVDISAIADSLNEDGQKLDFATPDKALESSYDCWALAELFKAAGKADLATAYAAKTAQYKDIWMKDFADLSKKDVDQLGARGMYQGTVWQYRWLVPYDLKGLVRLAGGDSAFRDQLDYFFAHDLYNHANEPDIEATGLYNATTEPWKSQQLTHKYAVDTVVQYYMDGNMKGVDPFMDIAFKNDPKAYIRTMDDDGGAMSGWFVFAATGMMPACVGEPIYYLHVPLFREVKLRNLKIMVSNPSDKRVYLSKVVLNGKELHRNYITQQEINKGGLLEITSSEAPVKDLVQEKWVSSLGASE
jgi:putative alpha-1,2-mannosidase